MITKDWIVESMVMTGYGSSIENDYRRRKNYGKMLVYLEVYCKMLGVDVPIDDRAQIAMNVLYDLSECVDVGKARELVRSRIKESEVI